MEKGNLTAPPTHEDPGGQMEKLYRPGSLANASMGEMTSTSSEPRRP